MARVLVTGASGFIGRHLVRHFSENGYEVVCLLRNTSDSSGIREFKPGIFLGDITDPVSVANAVRGSDLVVNLAGLTRSLSRKKMFAVNEGGVGVVAEACARQANPPVLLQISSLAVAGPASPDRAVTIADPPAPVSVYGQSKLAGENRALEYAGHVPLSILRPPIVFGEGDRDVYQIFRSISRWGLAFTPPFADRIFSIIHAADLANAIRLVFEKGHRVSSSPEIGVYYVTAPEWLTFNELVHMVGRILNRDSVRILQCPRWVTGLAGLMGESVSQILRSPCLLNHDKAREAISGAWHCDCQELQQLGFATPPLWSRLRQTAEWYLRQGWFRVEEATRFGNSAPISMAADWRNKIQ